MVLYVTVRIFVPPIGQDHLLVYCPGAACVIHHLIRVLDVIKRRCSTGIVLYIFPRVILLRAFDRLPLMATTTTGSRK